MIPIQILLALTLLIMAIVTIRNIRKDKKEGRDITYLFMPFRQRKVIYKETIPVRPAGLLFVLLCLIIYYYILGNYVENYGVALWMRIFNKVLIIISFTYAAWVMPNAPSQIGLTNESILLFHFGWIERIKLEDISSIKVDAPAKDVKRLTGSYGFSGYWGKREDKTHGKYYTCYGRPDKCIFIRLKNGDGYMVGSKNPQRFVEETKMAMAVLSQSK